MSALTVEALVEAGAHIGCRVSRWNPKMRPYILEARNRIHIIDLRQTVKGILRAKHFLREIVASGQDVLWVGTKPQIAPLIEKVAQRTSMPYVDDRWIGGSLTNYEVIRSRIAYLDELEAKEKEGYLDTLTKKEAARFMREKRKLWRNLHGIRDMYRLPGALVVVDPVCERNAVREAQRMGIPVVGIVDTDGDPESVDVVIPANDDAIRSVEMILDALAEAVEEGKRLREERGVRVPQPSEVAAAVAPVGRRAAPVPRPRGGGSRPRPGIRRVAQAVEVQAIEDEAAPSEAAAPEAEAARPSEAPAPEAAPSEKPADQDSPSEPGQES